LNVVLDEPRIDANPLEIRRDIGVTSKLEAQFYRWRSDGHLLKNP
jgi:hypothetical protein